MLINGLTLKHQQHFSRDVGLLLSHPTPIHSVTRTHTLIHTNIYIHTKRVCSESVEGVGLETVQLLDTCSSDVVLSFSVSSSTVSRSGGGGGEAGR